MDNLKAIVMYMGITNCMGNSWEIIIKCINTVTDDDFLRMLNNFQLSEECKLHAMIIKANIKNTNGMDNSIHLSIIKLYADNGYDVGNTNSMVDLQKITNVLIKLIEKQEKNQKNTEKQEI